MISRVMYKSGLMHLVLVVDAVEMVNVGLFQVFEVADDSPPA